MKISAWHKNRGHSVELLTDYTRVEMFDTVYVSKVFTDTAVPKHVLQLSNVVYGGTGFYYDKAEPLRYEVEHCMPDYHLYDEWVYYQLGSGGKKLDFKYYTDYSIGFLTRGCFRQCEFCVNKNYKRVLAHSPIDEFFDQTRSKTCLLDDNFFGYPKWNELMCMLQDTGRKFQFKQGLDERLLTDEKCKMLFGSNYDGDYIFAFDNIDDRNLIEEKARLIRRYLKNEGQNVKFYVLCGFDRTNNYDMNFWKDDIEGLFERVFILSKYNFKPYIMRFNAFCGAQRQLVR